MIVCSCNVLSDREILSAVALHRPQRETQVHGCLGCRPKCGQCLATIKTMLACASQAPAPRKNN